MNAVLDFTFQGRPELRPGRRRNEARAVRGRRQLHDPDTNAHGCPRSSATTTWAASDTLRTTRSDRAELQRARARARAHVPHPRPAGRLLRRRTGLHRRRRRQGRPAVPVRHPDGRVRDDDQTAHRPARRRPIDRYDTDAPLYQHIAALSELRAAHPALADGAQIERYAADGAGIYAFSRIDAAEQVEYLVADNNADDADDRDLRHLDRRRDVRAALRHAADGDARRRRRVTVTVPALSAVVLKAAPHGRRRRDQRRRLPARTPAARRRRRTAESAPTSPTTASTRTASRAARSATTAGQPLGTDDNAPPGVPRRQRPGRGHARRVPRRASRTPRATSRRRRRTASSATGPSPAPAPEEPAGRSTSRDSSACPAAHNTEMGCAGDWQPDCAQAQLALDARTSIWTRHSALPAGTVQYKVAIGDAWDENYGAGGAPSGGNIAYTSRRRPVTFYYDHRTHCVTATAQGPILTAAAARTRASSGAPATGSPDCLRRGCRTPTATAHTPSRPTDSPAGSYEVKVAHDLTGTRTTARAASDGANIPSRPRRQAA